MTRITPRSPSTTRKPRISITIPTRTVSSTSGKLPHGAGGRSSSTAVITLATLQPVIDAPGDIDVLLIGMGKEITGFDPAVRAALRERKIIVEAIATGGAVRTYNVLLAEGRQVAAALIAVESAR